MVWQKGGVIGQFGLKLQLSYRKGSSNSKYYVSTNDCVCSFFGSNLTTYDVGNILGTSGSLAKICSSPKTTQYVRIIIPR